MVVLKTFDTKSTVKYGFQIYYILTKSFKIKTLVLKCAHKFIILLGKSLVITYMYINVNVFFFSDEESLRNLEETNVSEIS